MKVPAQATARGSARARRLLIRMAQSSLRKWIILTAKILVAGALLIYVISKVHWTDYAVTLGGSPKSVQATRGRGAAMELQVPAEGGRAQWLPAKDFRPISLRTQDGRPVMVIDAQPDWQAPATYQVHLAGRKQSLPAGDFVPGSAQVVHRGFRTTVASANPYLLIVSFVAFIGPVTILSVRWWYLLRIQEIHIPLWEAVRLTFLGTFFNYVVPGTVSGDLVKAYYVSKHTERKAAALVTIFVDRVVGLVEFAALPAAVMVVMLAVGAGGTDRLMLPAIVVTGVLGGAFAALAFLLSPRLRRMFHLQKLAARLPLRRHLAVAAEAGNLYRRRLPALLKALGMTLGGQAIFITAIMLAGFSLAVVVPWYQYFLYVPIIYIIAAVPISPGGLGLAETFFVTFFTPAGSSPSEVLALALVARLFPMIVSLPGIVVALTGAKLPAASAMQAELNA